MPERPHSPRDPRAGRADDDALQVMLRDALKDVRTGAVDEQALSVGAGSRLRRQRRHHRLAVAAASVLALAVAVPVSVQALSGPAVRTVPAGPATASASPSPASPSSRTVLAPPKPPYVIPDLPLMTAAIPADQELTSLQTQDASIIPVSGQGCGDRQDMGPTQVTGRWWSYMKPDTRRSIPPGVEVVVTGWAAGGAPEVFQQLVDNTGKCRFGPEYGHSQRLYDLTVPGADESWATRSEVRGTVWGASRVGDLIVGITIKGMLADEAAPLLPPLLQAAVADLHDSGLPAVQGR